jgi:hypothetical protein
VLSVRTGVIVVGCVLVGFAASAGPGLVARAAEPARWGASSIESRGDSVFARDGAQAQGRISELERRVKELEAERAAAALGMASPERLRNELDAATVLNRELAERNRALSLQNHALAQGQLFDPPLPAACDAAPEGADPRAQLRYWAGQLRDAEGGFRRRLTSEQSAALGVLLRPKRPLDPSNPWREP